MNEYVLALLTTSIIFVAVLIIRYEVRRFFFRCVSIECRVRQSVLRAREPSLRLARPLPAQRAAAGHDRVLEESHGILA